MSDQILISRADGVCEVCLNRPEKRNAITFTMYEALYRGLHEAQEDAAVRVVLLGKPFDAATAERLGLVNRVVEEAVLRSEARALARALAQQPSGALLATRRLLRGDPQQVQARIEAEARIFATQLQSEEFRVAVRALLAKGRAG